MDVRSSPEAAGAQCSSSIVQSAKIKNCGSVVLYLRRSAFLPFYLSMTTVYFGLFFTSVLSRRAVRLSTRRRDPTIQTSGQLTPERHNRAI
jgi:hypothetical protein